MRTSALGVLGTALGLALAGPAAAAEPVVPASQPLVAVLQDSVARTAPDRHASRIELVRARRPLTRVRTVLPVLGEATDDDGRAWLRVRLPGRPNSHSGWISADQAKRQSTEWHLVLKLSTRRLTVYRNGSVARRYSVVIGTRSTPTPRGRFFIEEALALPGQAGGPFALAMSARSNVLQEFAGGPGQIAVHGIDGLAGARGTAASHGCIRLGTRAITWLARRVGGGVPLTVTR